MLQTSLSKKMLDEAAMRLKREMALSSHHESTIKNGLKFYREGFVYNATMLKNDVIEANVLDQKLYKPTIHLTHLSHSRCQCDSTFVCPHLLALFFYLYANVGQVGELIRDWNAKQSDSVLPVKKASELIASSASVHDWMEQFQEAYEHFFATVKKRDYQLIHHLCYRFFPSLLNNAPVPLAQKRLYHLHAALFTFCRLLEQGTHYQRIPYYRAFWEANVTDFMNTIISKCKDLLQISLPDSLDPLLEESREHIRHVLFASHLLMDKRIGIYQMIWSVLFRNSKWIKQEKEVLLQRKESEQRKGEEERFIIECQLALAHLAFLSDDDDETFALLDTFQRFPIPYALRWMADLADRQQWARLHRWLQIYITHMESYLASTNYYDGEAITRETLYLFERYAEATGDNHDYETLLKVSLPYSASEYSYFLLTNKQYKKWVDLHLLADISVDDIHRSFLKVIETHDRSLLLPLYHRTVAKMLQLKNRQSYKIAVKHLKKLRAHYRALKQEEAWHAYMTKLIEENKRLRAFQEELKKGKLLND